MNVKLTAADRKEIIKYYIQGARQYEIATHFNVSAMTISRVVRDNNAQKPKFHFNS